MSILPWSYSSLQAYETCPRRFYLTRVTRQVKEAQHAATLYGNEVHRALEYYVSNRADLPTKFESYRAVSTRVKLTDGAKHTEMKLGMTADYQPCEYSAANVWARCKIDVAIVRPDEAIIIDWKTGKIKDDPSQLELFAAIGMTHWPFAKQITTSYFWLADNKIDSMRFTQENKPVILQGFTARVHRMQKSEIENDWPPNPSGLCKSWCPVGKANCDYCGKD